MYIVTLTERFATGNLSNESEMTEAKKGEAKYN